MKQLVFVNETSSKDRENSTNNVVEAVVHVQGIIWRHDLPPFRNQAMYVICPIFIVYVEANTIFTSLELQTR